MRLSVVIVTYRSAGVLPGLLDALGAQVARGDEVIVVDNDSGDGGAEIADGHGAVTTVVRTGGNLGFAGGCNLGAQVASGDVLLLLNPDCAPEPGFLDAMRAPPKGWGAWMGLVTLPDGAHVNTAGGVVHYLGLAWAGRYGQPVTAIPEAPHAVGFLSGACMAVRMPVWRALGGFPEEYFMYLEDVDLSLRLRLAGHRFGILPAARVRHDYAFTKGAGKWRMLERNRWLTVVRTYPAPLLFAVLPAMLAAEPGLVAIAHRGGWGGAKLRAMGGVLAGLPRAIVQRRRVQAAARVDAVTFARGLTADLDSPFLGAPARSPLVAGPVRVYWRLVTALLRRGRRPA